MKRLLSALTVLLCVLLFLMVTNSRPTALPQYIMHAGGITPDGIAGSNSVEAMDHSYAQGYHWLEIDFNWTSDGHLACVHDWDAFYSANLTGLPAPDLELYEKLRKYTYGYENHSLESLVAWMENHPQAVIVTDVKEENLRAAEEISRYESLRDRFVIQIYDTGEYETVVSHGFERLIFTFYKIPPGKPALTQLAQISNKMEKIIAVTIPAQEEYAELTDMARELEIPYYVHTVNDSQVQQQWIAEGAQGVYCDIAPHDITDPQ